MIYWMISARKSWAISNNSRIVEALIELPLSTAKDDNAANLLLCYRKLVDIAIIPPEELPIVEAWIEAVAHLTKGGGTAGHDHARGFAQ